MPINYDLLFFLFLTATLSVNACVTQTSQQVNAYPGTAPCRSTVQGARR